MQWRLFPLWASIVHEGKKQADTVRRYSLKAWESASWKNRQVFDLHFDIELTINSRVAVVYLKQSCGLLSASDAWKGGVFAIPIFFTWKKLVKATQKGMPVQLTGSNNSNDMVLVRNLICNLTWTLVESAGAELTINSRVAVVYLKQSGGLLSASDAWKIVHKSSPWGGHSQRHISFIHSKKSFWDSAIAYNYLHRCTLLKLNES